MPEKQEHVSLILVSKKSHIVDRNVIFLLELGVKHLVLVVLKKYTYYGQLGILMFPVLRHREWQGCV